jgi:hypothetical protein
MPERWYVLQTFPSKEAKVMRRFRDRGISAITRWIAKCRPCAAAGSTVPFRCSQR